MKTGRILKSNLLIRRRVLANEGAIGLCRVSFFICATSWIPCVADENRVVSANGIIDGHPRNW